MGAVSSGLVDKDKTFTAFFLVAGVVSARGAWRDRKRSSSLSLSWLLVAFAGLPRSWEQRISRRDQSSLRGVVSFVETGSLWGFTEE